MLATWVKTLYRMEFLNCPVKSNWWLVLLEQFVFKISNQVKRVKSWLLNNFRVNFCFKGFPEINLAYFLYEWKLIPRSLVKWQIFHWKRFSLKVREPLKGFVAIALKPKTLGQKIRHSSVHLLNKPRAYCLPENIYTAVLVRWSGKLKTLNRLNSQLTRGKLILALILRLILLEPIPF